MPRQQSVEKFGNALLSMRADLELLEVDVLELVPAEPITARMI